MKHLLLILAIFFGSFLHAQDDTVEVDMNKYQKVYLGDTAWVFVLKDLEKTEYNSYYYWMVSRVKRMKPFAEYAVDLLTDIDSNASDNYVSKDSKKKAKKANKKLKDDFKQSILYMSEKDGNVLCKLIHRETGMSAYEIIRKYRGKSKAVYWQSLAKLGGADLKQTFNPKKDIVLDKVMKDVESGKVKVPKEPDLITKEERKKKMKAYRKRKKSKKKRSRQKAKESKS